MDAKQAADLVREHLTGPVSAEEWVQHVEFDPELERWYLRFTCEGRDATTIYFDLRPRSLRYEIYFMPDPPKNHLELYRWLLRRNARLHGIAFAVDDAGDVYLVGRLPLVGVTPATLDALLGALLDTADSSFDPLLAMGFLGSMRREWAWRVSRGESTRNLEAFRHLLER